jgi:hypothetical protein
MEMNALGRANPILVSTWVLAEGADPLCFFFLERKESEISSDVSWGSGTYNTPSICCFITVTFVYSHICIFDQLPAICDVGLCGHDIVSRSIRGMNCLTRWSCEHASKVELYSQKNSGYISNQHQAVGFRRLASLCTLSQSHSGAKLRFPLIGLVY